MNKNDFAPLPPMGWNSYDYYDTTVDEARVRANADYMAAHLKGYGWEYVVVDIQWYAHGAGSMRDKYQYIPFSALEMDEYSRLLPDPERFPSSAGGAGFKPLADYVHSLGLKFGIHIMRGIPRQAAHAHTPVKPYDAALSAEKDSVSGRGAELSAGSSRCIPGGKSDSGMPVTAADVADPSSICGWNPDMYGVRNCAAGQAYYDSLMELYASWGVDYIKCDDICNTNIYPHNPYSARHEIEMLSRAIRRYGRPIVLSLSPGPALIEQANHYKIHANLWRITDDLWDRWSDILQMFWRCELWQDHVERGCYPDCDMLPLGRIGGGFGEGQERSTNLTRDEQRTLMTLWCIFGSPLMLGAEMTKLDDWTLSLLTNRDILAMRTPDCRPRQLFRTADEAAWTACNEKTGEMYVAVFNLSDKERTVSADDPALYEAAGAAVPCAARPCAAGRITNDNCTGAQFPDGKDAEEIHSSDSTKSVPVYTELWTGREYASLSAALPPHGCRAFRVSR